MKHVWMVRFSFASGAFSIKLFRTKARALEHAKAKAEEGEFNAVAELEWHRYHNIRSGVDFMTVLKVEVN